MRLWWTIAALPVASLSWALAQDPAPTTQDSGGSGLVRVPEGAADFEPPGAQDPAPFDRLGWRGRLTDSRLDEREAQFDAFLDLARTDERARDALADWARDGANPDLAWTARLALRELRRERNAEEAAPRQDLADPFRLGPGTMHGNLRDLFGPDGSFDAQFFGPDRDDPMRSLEESFEWLLEEPWRFGFSPVDPGDPGAPGLPGTRSMESQSFQMRMGPDGVQVEIDVDENGERTRKTYEAESLDQLLEQHPELKDRIGAAPTFPDDTRRDLQGIIDRLREDRGVFTPRLRRVLTPAIRTDRLGVYMQEPTAEARRSGAEDVGLRVDSILPGSLGEALGVQPGDTLVELNGTRLWSGDDVARVLRERDADNAVRLRLFDAKGEEKTLTWSPEK